MSSQPWSTKFLGHDLWTADLSTLTLWPRLRLRFLRFAIVAVEEFSTNQLDLRAAGLVYSTLLSSVPFLAVTFSVLKAFGVHQQIEPFLGRALEPLGPNEAEVTGYMIGFINNLQVGVLGAVGVAGLFFTVISLIGKIEDALNHIWRVRYPRALARKFSDYLSVVLVGPVLVFTAFSLTASAQSNWVLQQLQQHESLHSVVTVVTRVMPLLFLCVAFTFVYKFVPNTHVHFRSALIAGTTAGLLWQVAGIGFAAFVASSAHYTAIYSSFAVLLLFLFWLYMGWLIVLVGGEVAYLHQHAAAFAALGPRRRRSALFRMQLALSTLATITCRYLTQEPPWRLAELSVALHVSSAELEELIDKFVQRRILLRTIEPEGLALGRPPEDVPVSEILDAADDPEQLAVAEDDPVALILRRRDRAIRQALAGLTLRSLSSKELVKEALVSDDALSPSVPSTSAGRVRQ
ncbi:MAG TPA: YihY/virulence factor BrkB family protein [Candidatus Binatia bacterium]|nr:YihY/virulence factor BrkB family protein [Candidatus Binatia bacterium]